MIGDECDCGCSDCRVSPVCSEDFDISRPSRNGALRFGGREPPVPLVTLRKTFFLVEYAHLCSIRWPYSDILECWWMVFATLMLSEISRIFLLTTSIANDGTLPAWGLVPPHNQPHFIPPLERAAGQPRPTQAALTFEGST
jgi:hypothetical protein